MKSAVVKSLFVLFLLFLISHAFAAKNDLKKLKAEYEELAQQGNLEQAIEKAREALKIVHEKHGPDHLEFAYIVDDMAAMYFQAGNAVEADLHYINAIHIYQKSLPEDHEKITNALNSLGNLYMLKGKFSDAELYLQRSLELTISRLGENHREVATVLNNLAMTMMGQEKFAETEDLFTRSLAIYEKNVVPKDMNKANMLSNFGYCLIMNEKFSDAEKYLKQALQIIEEANYPANNTTLNTLKNSAVLYLKMENDIESARFFNKLLEVTRKLPGNYRPEVAAIFDHLGYIYLYQEKIAEAEQVFREAYEILERHYDYGHEKRKEFISELYTQYFDNYGDLENIASNENYIDLLNLRGWIYVILPNSKLAKEAYQQALETSEQRYGLIHPKTIETITKMSQFNYVSDSLWAQIVPVMEEKTGRDNPEFARALYNWADLIWFKGFPGARKSRIADSLYALSLDIRKKTLGLEHPETIESLEELAGGIRGQDYAKSDSIYQLAISLRKKVSCYSSPEGIETLRALGDLNKYQDNYEKYFQYYQEALNVSQFIYGGLHKNSGEIAEEMAEQYLEQENYTQAEKYYLLALDNYSYGRPLNYDMLPSLSKLTGIYEKLEQWEKKREFQFRLLEAHDKLGTFR